MAQSGKESMSISGNSRLWDWHSQKSVEFTGLPSEKLVGWV
jgi:hypothetical protein